LYPSKYFPIVLACNAVIKSQSKQPESQNSYVFHANEAVCKKNNEILPGKMAGISLARITSYPGNALWHAIKKKVN